MYGEDAKARALELIDELAQVLVVEPEALAGELSLRDRHLTLARMILDSREAGLRQTAILDARSPGITNLGEEHGAALEALAASTGESAQNLVLASSTAAELVRVSASIQASAEVGPMSEAQAQLDVVREGVTALAQLLLVLAKTTAANRELALRLAGRAKGLRKATRETEAARELSVTAEAAIADSLAQLLSHEQGPRSYRIAAQLHALRQLIEPPEPAEPSEPTEPTEPASVTGEEQAPDTQEAGEAESEDEGAG